MNQNIFGVILFSVIVGTAILISEMFVTLPTPAAVYERPTYESRTTCHRRVVNQTTPVGVASIKVVQAVLNQQTNQLDTDFLIKKENPQTEAVGIALHFFVKDGGTTRYLATETITGVPEYNHDGTAKYSVISSFKWLNDLKSRDNLYVLAESSIPFQRSKLLTPNFDEANASPVLLAKGRGF